VVLLGGDLGGPIVQDLALRYPDWVDRDGAGSTRRLPYLKEAMAGITGTPRVRGNRRTTSCARAPIPMRWLPSWATPRAGGRRYIATFLHESLLVPSRRVHRDRARLDFHTEPFGDAAHLRASFGAYEGAPSIPARPAAANR